MAFGLTAAVESEAGRSGPGHDDLVGGVFAGQCAPALVTVVREHKTDDAACIEARDRSKGNAEVGGAFIAIGGSVVELSRVRKKATVLQPVQLSRPARTGHCSYPAET